MSTRAPDIPTSRPPFHGRRAAPRSRSLLAQGAAALFACLHGAWTLLAPEECTCGAAGALLCPDCAGALDPARALRVEHLCDALQMLPHAGARLPQRAPGPALLEEHYTSVMPVLSLGEYARELRALVLGWKNGGRQHLTARFAEAIAPLLDTLAGEDEEVLLVPAPSSWAARARRGEDHVRELARALAARRPGTRVAPVIGAVVASQEGRGARGRANREVLRRPWHRRLPPDAPAVIILDDVVTTGATLRALAAAVRREHGPPLLGAVTIASARWPRPSPLAQPRQGRAPGTSAGSRRRCRE